MQSNQISSLNKLEDMLKATVDLKFEYYLELQDFIESHISAVQEDLDKKWDEIDKLQAEEYNQALDDVIGGDLFRFEHEFPNRARYLSIVQTYTILEVSIKWLCGKLKNISNIQFEMNDLKGNSDLEKAKLYLLRAYGLNIADLQPEWKFINDMRKLRNHIVHKNGEFRLRDREIYELVIS